MGNTTSSRSGTNDYQYEHLIDSAEIRCLTLSAGNAKDPLVCVVKHYSLNDHPHFEAISYVWGDHAKDQTITCNGHRLDITSNLHKSLQQVRHADRERILWADSICINQDNKKEKGHQVSLMARIYSQADRVLVTLGADGFSSAHAEGVAALVREVSDVVETTIAKIEAIPNSYPFDQAVHPLSSDPRWGSLARLTDHPWFTRGWVIQEVGLARDAWLFWGLTSFNWVDFANNHVAE